MQLRECISIICSPGEGALLDSEFAMQLRRCITRGFGNHSGPPPFHLLRVWDITVDRVLEMSERVIYKGFPIAALGISKSHRHTSAFEFSLAHLASPHARTPSLTLPLFT
jgi:hypothetical protein